MKVNKESGYMLVGTILAIAILSVVGMSLVTLSFHSVKTSTSERDNQAVYYIAEAGLNYLANEFEQAVNEIYTKENVETEEDFYNEINDLLVANGLPSVYDNFEKVNQFQPYATIKVETDATEFGKYRLISEGYLEDNVRIVEQIVELDFEKEVIEIEDGNYELPPFAVYTTGNMTIGNGTITGDIGVHGDDPNHDGLNFTGNTNVTINGNIYVPNGDPNYIKGKGLRKGPEIKDIKDYSYPTMPPFPAIPDNYPIIPDQSHNGFKFINNGQLFINSWQINYYTFPLTNDVYIKDILFGSNNTFTIDTGNENRSIVVDRLHLDGMLKIKGEGKLTIYVKEELNLSQGEIGSLDKINNLNIFYDGNKDLNISNNITIFGSLNTNNANLYVGRGGSIHGNIFTNGDEVVMTGGSKIRSQLVFAPNAAYTMSGGGNLEGMIIAKTFNSEGGANVTLKEPFVLDGPISPQALGSRNDDDHSDSQPGNNEIEERIKNVSTNFSSIKEINK